MEHFEINDAVSFRAGRFKKIRSGVITEVMSTPLGLYLRVKAQEYPSEQWFTVRGTQAWKDDRSASQEAACL